MRIVFICNEYPPSPYGGIGVLLSGLSEGLAAAGASVHVVGTYPLALPIEETVAGVRVHRVPAVCGRAGVLGNGVALHRAISDIAKHRRIDIVEAPDFEAPSALLPRHGAVHVIRLHGSHAYFACERGERPSKLVRVLERVALARADAWIAPSDYTAAKTQQVFGVRRACHTIYNVARVSGVYRRKETYAAAKRVVYFGTLAEKKGVLTLAVAWREFSKRHPGWRLTAIGRDALYAGASVRARMCDLLGPQAETVEFRGPLSNHELLACLSTYDFAVLPSFSETFAITPMEAMALGVPVVFTRLASGPELIEHGKDGWLADPRDAADLAEVMTVVAADTAMREAVGRAGRRKIETRFSFDAFVKQNAAVYERLLDETK